MFFGLSRPTATGGIWDQTGGRAVDFAYLRQIAQAAKLWAITAC